VIDVKVQKSKAEFTKNLFTLNIIKSKYFDKLKSIYQNKKAQEKELNSLSTKLSYKEIKFLTFGDIEKKHLELVNKGITNESGYKFKYAKNEITDLAKVFSDSESKYIIIKELNRQLKNLFSIIINHTDNVIPPVNKEEILKVIKKYFNLSDDNAKIKFLKKNLDLSTKEKSLKTFYFTVFLQTENEKTLKKKMSVEEARFTVLETFTFLNEY
jgi:septum formation topological specificity factor MinE